MNVEQFVINVNSEQPERLTSFYKDIVGLTPRFDITPGAFMVGSSSFVALIVEGHNEVKGSTREPARVLLNFVVDDVIAEQQRLESQGVHFTRPAYTEAGVGVFATFADPDGNCCQLAQLAT